MKKKTKPETTGPRFAEIAEPMTGEAFGAALEALDISRSAFGRLIGSGGRTVRGWIAGDFPVPMPVGYLVALMLRTKTRPEDLKL
jgi:DNA-binding transcriptional regulator YiaG